MPNTEVKLSDADDSQPATARENMSLPRTNAQAGDRLGLLFFTGVFVCGRDTFSTAFFAGGSARVLLPPTKTGQKPGKNRARTGQEPVKTGQNDGQKTAECP